MNDLTTILKSLNNSPSGDGGVYFLGIGGIGMSALARYFNSKGVVVSGYDKTETTLTKQLVAEGINIHFEDNVELIDKKAQLVVYTPAVPKDHAELNYFLQNNYTVVKRSDVLGAITNNSFNICIAGTHGKTTTSTMVAHILRHSGFGSNAFLGGIAVNYNTNFWPAPIKISTAFFIGPPDKDDCDARRHLPFHAIRNCESGACGWHYQRLQRTKTGRSSGRNRKHSRATRTSGLD